MLIGESFVGEGAEAAHVNTVLGDRHGPVGTAWATALATPRQGHIPFVTALRPSLPVKPLTLFVNKAPVLDDAHANLTWGAAQAGVARGSPTRSPRASSASRKPRTWSSSPPSG